MTDTERDLVLFLVGPTAVGKTDVSLVVAQEMSAEIISADSMQIYRQMDVGTAKPTPAERLRVPHHLLDIAGPREEFNTARFVALARRCITEVSSRGKLPLVVGGTPLYLKALAEGMFAGPPADKELRARLDAEYEQLGPQAMHARLRECDPESAGRLHPNDRKRILRALEVRASTGKPISQLQRQFGQLAPWLQGCFVGLRRSREDLYSRINRRVEKMFADGLASEVRSILGSGGFGPQSSRALGYKEVAEAIRAGTDPLDTMEEVKKNTRHMARKQLTWFKHMGYVRWLDIPADEDAAATGRRLVALYGDMLTGAAARKP